MTVVPDKTTVLSSSPGKSEFGPDPDLALSPDLLCAVIRRIGNSEYILGFICRHSVIEHDIRENTDPDLMKSPDRVEIFLFRAVLGAHCTFLVKFPEVIHIIDPISDIILGRSFVGGRKPDICDADSVEVFRFCGTAFPPKPVIRQIPFKILHHCPVH